MHFRPSSFLLHPLRARSPLLVAQLGLLSGHTYYFLSEVRPFLLLPERVSLGDLAQLCLHGTPLVLPEPPASEDESRKEGGDEGGDEGSEEGGDGAEAAGDDGEATGDASRQADGGKVAAASE